MERHRPREVWRRTRGYTPGEARYTLALQKRQAAPPVEIRLKAVAGFVKLDGISR
jgi:hypothetical protein